jgi:hypothetical protein
MKTNRGPSFNFSNFPNRSSSRRPATSVLLFGVLMLFSVAGFAPRSAAQDQAPQAVVTASFEGLPSDFTLEPPDPHGAAGPFGIIQVINVRIAYWSKTGTQKWAPKSFTQFFPWAASAFQSDPRCLYDPIAQRFYVEILEIDFNGGHAYIDLAVSKSSNPASSTSADWYFYRIENTHIVGGVPYFGDYSALGYDDKAIYMSLNTYDIPTESKASDDQITIINKASALSGTTNYSFLYIPGGGNAAFTLQPCTVVGTNGPGNVAYFGETFPAGSATQVRVWALSDPLGAKTMTSSLVTIPNNGSFPPNNDRAPQPGTSHTVDTLDGRTQGNAFWVNGSIWFCHTAGGSAGRSMVYYYRVSVAGFPGAAPTLGESGHIDGGSGMWTYQPSISGNARGDVCLVYCGSSSVTNPTIFYMARAGGSSTFDPVGIVKASPGYYNGTRWGDYGSVSVDPVDQTFWVTHEWAKTTGSISWSTWWGNILIGGPPIISSDPASATVYEGDTATMVVQASSSLRPSYRWFFQGSQLPGYTTSALILTGVTPDQAGPYFATVSNSFGVSTSQVATLTIIPTVPLPIALDATNLDWSTDGNANWHGLTDVSHDGVAAGQTCCITNGGHTRVLTTVTGPGTLTFWWKVSSQANSDYLSFSVNGTTQASISGEVDWQQQTYYLPVGSLTLAWNYTKDASGSDGLDKAWLDQVSYTSGPTLPLIVTQPADQAVVAGSPASFAVAAGGTPQLSYQWRYKGNPIPGATGTSYSLAQAWFTNTGTYSVAVSNDYGFVFSSNALLSVAAITAWGNNDFGQLNPIAGLTNVIAIAAGGYHNLALRSDGAVLAWGDDFDGQIDVPAGLNHAVSIAAGSYHSVAALADGSVMAWGADYSGQTDVPAKAVNVVAVSAGSWHNLALRADGTVIAWGDDSLGQCDVPAGLSNVIAIACGGEHSLALKNDGTVVAWGNDIGPNGDHTGQADVPWGLNGVVAIAGGDFHSLAMKADGTLVGWGDNSSGQLSVPAGLTKAVAIAAGGAHSLAIQEGGTVFAWGDNLFAQSIPPGNVSSASEIAAGAYHSLALLGLTPSGPALFNASWHGSTFSVLLQTIAGKAYFLQSKSTPTDSVWSPVSAILGNGGVKSVTDTAATGASRFYRVRQQ